jgi:LPS-assembly protein
MFLRKSQKIFTFFALIFFAENSFALPSLKKEKSLGTPSVLRADQIDADKAENILIAKGHAELRKDSSVIFANRMTYSKDKKTIRAIGNVVIKDLEIGNMWADEGELKDDFSSGKFINSKIVFKDGSYLSSPEIDRESPTSTTLYDSIYAICPDDEIVADNGLAGKKFDMATISSSSNNIDRATGKMKIRNGVFKLYSIPVFYSPYMKITLPSKERESGFLTPSYAKNSNFGLSVKIPYYFNIAPNMDLTTTPQIAVSGGQVMLTNDFQHLTDYGKYNLNFELANNELKHAAVNRGVIDPNNTALINKTNKKYRWGAAGKGSFDFTTNAGLNFDLNTISDTNFLRDYHFSYLAYTESKVNLDYIKGRDYYSIKSVRFQELQNKQNANQAQFVLPSISTYSETKKSLFFKEKFALTTNFTTIAPSEGMQYRRFTATPEVKVPFNIKGNLFEIDAKVQTDLYSIENNFKSDNKNNNYKQFESNYKPEISASWKLPLIQKTKLNTLIFEPMVTIVSSSYKKNFSQIANQDSSNSELTVSNLFVSDRIYGYDRNEAGQRVSYGFKSSLFNKLGEFGLTLGQSYRMKTPTQDVSISGFSNNNKSNLVGQALYKSGKHFEIFYTFQLNESSYRNDINQVMVNLNFDRIKFSTDYILLKQTVQNPLKKEQMTLSANAKLTDRWNLTISTTEDLILKRTLLRNLILTRDGCCTIFGVSVTQTNPSALVKAQQSISFNIVFKNL